MRHAVPIALLLLGSTLAVGCNNACQALCGEMYDYALECGHPVSKDELKSCRQSQSNANTPRSERAQCRANFDDLRAEWTCEDLADYWDGEGGQTQPQDTAVDTASGW
jgi:hypothetical protein